MSVVEDECVFFLHTVQSHALRCTIEALKDVLLDVSIHINKEGLKICCLDYSRTAIVYLKIDGDKCERYKCEMDMSIGISVSALFKLVKSTSMSDLISLYILRTSLEKLRISIDCRDRCMVIESELNTLDLDDDSIQIPAIDFTTILIMPSAEFQKNVRDLANVSDYVTISTKEGSFSMSASGDFATQRLTFRERLNGLQFQAQGDQPIQGTFSLKYLTLFSKSTALSGFVELYLRQDIPLVLKYSIGSIGRTFRRIPSSSYYVLFRLFILIAFCRYAVCAFAQGRRLIKEAGPTISLHRS
jgi:proliferating cell nuclear antigen